MQSSFANGSAKKNKLRDGFEVQRGFKAESAFLLPRACKSGQRNGQLWISRGDFRSAARHKKLKILPSRAESLLCSLLRFGPSLRRRSHHPHAQQSFNVAF